MADRNVSNNVYTVLTLVALLVLLAGVGFLLYYSNELFGTWNPLDAPELSSILLPGGMGGIFG